MNLASDSDWPSIGSDMAISNAELESMRRHSIRVLSSVAAALEAAGHQRQTLLAEVHTAQQALRALASEREIVEASLAASRAQFNQAATKLEHAEVQCLGILREIEDLRSTSARNRESLAVEIAALERRRDGFTIEVAGSPVVDPPVPDEVVAPKRTVSADGLIPAQRPSAGAVRRPTWSIVFGLVRTRLEQEVFAHPLHPGFGNVATGLFIALFLAMAVLLSPLTQVFGGLQLLAVTSGSMAPGIPTGSIVAVRAVPASSLKPGDVITFANPSTPDVLVTHRVVSVDVRDGQTMLTTKGDANESVDALAASANRAVGRVDFALPWLGDAMVWLGSPTAKIAIVCLAVLAVGLSLASIQRSTRHPLAVH